MSKHFVCRDCGFVGRGTVRMKGSKTVERLLWGLLFIPGPFYSLWRHLSKKTYCTKCNGTSLVDVESVEGRILFEKQLKRFK